MYLCKGMFLGTANLANLCMDEFVNQVKIENDFINFVDEFKYLGIILDNKLTFKNHCDFIVKKISKKLGYLQRISCHLSPWSKLLVYKTIVQPHFEFRSLLFYQVFMKDINRLQKLQNRAMRILF